MRTASGNYIVVMSNPARHYLYEMYLFLAVPNINRRFERWCQENDIHSPNVRTAKRFVREVYHY